MELALWNLVSTLHAVYPNCLRRSALRPKLTFIERIHDAGHQPETGIGSIAPAFCYLTRVSMHNVTRIEDKQDTLASVISVKRLSIQCHT